MAETVTFSEALAQYLGQVKNGNRVEAQRALTGFIRWCGKDRPCTDLTPPEVEKFVLDLGGPGAASAKRLESVKAFLNFLHKHGYTPTKLALHVKPPRQKRSGSKTSTRSHQDVSQTRLTVEGTARLQDRLKLLKEERIHVIEDMTKAAADKDFRENAPLQAARERKGFLEGEIADLESVLRDSTIMEADDGQQEKRVRLGRKVTLKEEISDRQVVFTLVDTREANPAQGKISPVSPVGRAIFDRNEGDLVEIAVPRGLLAYRIVKVEG